MKRTKHSHQARPTSSDPQPSPAEATKKDFRTDLREIIFPANKWHYAFHVVVVVVALAYWIASLIFQPQASWAEIVMYRPGGDNQLWPIITALSHLNLGDPTDSLHYGQGIGGFHAVILLPYAFAFAIFGPAGYMITDAVLCWCYFVAAAMLFRRWGLGTLASVVLSASLTTSSLQLALNKLSEDPARIITLLKHGLTEWDFPNIFSLSIFGSRIPRPLPTEIFLVLILYFVSRLWVNRRLISLKTGLAIGLLMGLLVQGDPYSFAASGLVILAVIVRAAFQQRWRVPWRFCAGGILGAALSGWYLVLQMLFENPDSAARFGLAKYSRSHILLLPGYGPWLRVLIVLEVALVIHWLIRRYRPAIKDAAKSLHVSTSSESDEPGTELSNAAQLALLAVVIVLAGFAAQPIQLLLLGKGAEIFHYLLATLPIFYSFAMLLLVIQLFKVLNWRKWFRTGEVPRPNPSGIVATLCGAALVLMLFLGFETPIDTMMYAGLSRQDPTPWSVAGNKFRPALRGLDKAFRENPVLKKSRSFATLCQEVNYLLTAFHNKRAYLPDNAFTTLSDDELERRLCEVGKIAQIKPEEFAAMIQNQYVLNYWLGCAKYWCTSDHKFAPESDYPPERLKKEREGPKEAPFHLALPNSEGYRIMGKYLETLKKPSNTSEYPDAVIFSLVLRGQNITLDTNLYRETYTNAVFSVFTKVPGY